MSDKTEHPAIPEAFAKLGVRPSILRALAEAKFVEPSEIQAMLIPRALEGVDILGQARTGTGKTAAFAIPILQKCERGLATQAIVLVPTRELAVQVETEIKRLAQFTPIRSIAVYGGQKITAQVKFLRTHPEIIVGTPGRVIDLLDRRIISFENIRFAVLDEVDRMLDIGFRDDIRNILSRIKGVQTEGEGESEPQAAHQTMFVSATISDEIERLARRYMREPVEKLIAPGADEKPTVEKVEQYYISVEPWDKYRALRQLLLNENPDLAIVFCRTKHGAEKLAKKLHADGIECREIHGNLNQGKRDRVMKGFRGGKFDVLIATDLASRGIDVADISHIINYDIPEDPEVYVHRVGRTARMGAQGKAFTLVHRDQGDELTKVENLINMMIPQAKVEGFDPSPMPGDWKEGPPEPAVAAAAPQPNRYERPYSPVAGGTAPTVALPPRTIGSKIPINRRHRRRR
ncbi:MAG TPA: DEAD/DEAH box helicase [Tepidisphaeraceae bacterium]|nr:DEAD/DEAH box helicase [Tepidisphaeraceae bacterium]